MSTQADALTTQADAVPTQAVAVSTHADGPTLGLSETTVKSASSIGTSILVHISVLVALYMVPQALAKTQPDVLLESIFQDDRVLEEYTQVLETETEVATTANFVSGGAVSTAAGGGGGGGGSGSGGGGTGGFGVSQGAIESGTGKVLTDPQIRVNVGVGGIPGDGLIGQDLGSEEVSGEAGAVVEGYGAALSRITQELIRVMRQQKVLAVWLFDESNSMKDDQKEIRDNFHKVYEELGIQTRTDTTLKKSEEPLTTVVLGFGKDLHKLTAAPTANIAEIKAAIDKISVDESGDENMCKAISDVVDEYGAGAARQKRRLVLIVVSDESPTDDNIATMVVDKLEPAIDKCKKMKVPVYCLGREAIFGYPYARMHWRDPVFNLSHWVVIDRGPETEFPECLQYDGIGARWDSFSSGFGPYSQVRLARETGGIFFMLPGEEADLTGPGANEKREFEALAMKEYQPLLLPRRDYLAERQKSEFRSRIWDIIVRLNPHLDSQMSVRLHHYSTDAVQFAQEAQPQFQRAAYAMDLLSQAIQVMEDTKRLRAKEDAQRWRADFDLIYAQCICYRVRLFQYLLVLDQHVASKPKPTNPKNNEWNIGWAKDMLVPDDDQFARLKKHYRLSKSRQAYLEEMKEEQQKSEEAYQLVEREHPGTPWARRAEFERKARGYGMYIVDGFRDPRYADVGSGRTIKIPKF